MTTPAAAQNMRAKMAQTISDFCHEIFHGKDDKRRTQVMDLLYTTPEGKILLDVAAKYDVPIRFTRTGNVGAMGSLSKLPEDTTVSVAVANTGNVPQMVMTLYHELRHLQQQQEMGNIQNGVFRSMQNVGRSHILSMMQEADAFTTEAMFALQRKAEGDTQYYDSMMKGAHDLARVSAGYIKKAPVSFDENPDAFRRGLFTHIMTEGLAGYSAGYFLSYAMTFARAETKEDFAAAVFEKPEMRMADKQSDMVSVYGSKYMAKTSLPLAASMFIKTLPHDEQQALKLVEKTVRDLPKMTEDEYQAAREKAKTALLAVYQTDPRDLTYSAESDSVRSVLKASAVSGVPAARADFAKAAARKFGIPRSFQPQKQTGPSL